MLKREELGGEWKEFGTVHGAARRKANRAAALAASAAAGDSASMSSSYSATDDEEESGGSSSTEPEKSPARSGSRSYLPPSAASAPQVARSSFAARGARVHVQRKRRLPSDSEGYR
jgi:hypothetical protein